MIQLALNSLSFAKKFRERTLFSKISLVAWTGAIGRAAAVLHSLRHYEGHTYQNSLKLQPFMMFHFYVSN